MAGFPQVGFLKPLVKSPNVVVGLDGAQGDDQLRGWVRQAVKFVRKLPVK